MAGNWYVQFIKVLLNIIYSIFKSSESLWLRLCACVIIFSLTDFNVICPWEAYSHLELHELAQYGII